MKRHTRSLIDLIRQLPSPPKAGAEIGVWTGHNAAALLAAYPELVLYGIDDYRGCPNGHITGEEAEQEAFELLRPYSASRDDRYQLIKQTSELASGMMSCVLDFIFIDASHDYESCKADIALWAPNVITGGLIAGHDYSRHHKGVVQAVDEAFGDRAQVASGKVWWVIKE